MNTVRVSACAKLNLTLDVTGTEGGYHMLDSLVTTIDLSDRIVAKKRAGGQMRVIMHGMGSESIDPAGNNALRAAEAFAAAFGTGGAEITVYKNIPLGAGLGGSSADAAGVLRALSRLYGVEDAAALKRLADGLGSDTGYLLTGGFARLRGRGERVQPLVPLPEMHFLLLCPKEGVSSAACFRAYDELGVQEEGRTERVLGALSSGNAEWAAKLFGNALTRAAQSLEPAAKAALDAARSFSPLGAGMTGSGSAAYAYFPTRELCEWARTRYRGSARAMCVKSVNVQEKKGTKSPFFLGAGEGLGS